MKNKVKESELSLDDVVFEFVRFGKLKPGSHEVKLDDLLAVFNAFAVEDNVKANPYSFGRKMAALGLKSKLSRQGRVFMLNHKF